MNGEVYIDGIPTKGRKIAETKEAKAREMKETRENRLNTRNGTRKKEEAIVGMGGETGLDGKSGSPHRRQRKKSAN